MKQSAFTKDRFSFARALSLLLLISVLLPTLSFAQGQYTRFEPESGSVTKFQTGTGTVETQGKSEWSAGQQLWWRDAKIGQSLELTLQVPAPGFYRVVTGLTKAFDYGIFDFTVDGKVALRNVDFYSPNEKLPTPLTLAEATFLDAGPVKIVATVRGANPLAVKTYMLGWDYIDLVPVPQPVERSLTVEAGSVPVELNLSQQNPAPVDWVQPIVWQLSEQRPDWANISPSGVLTLAPPISAMDSQKSSPIFAVARDSSNPQKSQSFLLTLQVKQPSIPSENELVFSETISVTPSQTSSPVSVTNLVSQNPSLNGGQATLYATSSNGQFQIALQDGQLTVSAIPHAIPGTYAVFVAIADPQNPASKKIGRLVVRVQPPSITKPDIALSKTIVRGDSNQESGTLNLSNSLGAIGESLVSPLTFEKLPDAVGYSEGISVVANGSSVSFTAIENQAAPESTNTPFYFLVTDNSVPKRKVSVLVNLTVQQPSVPQDAPPTDRFSLPIPVLMGAQSQPINLEASLPQTLNLSAAKAFSLLRNPHQAKISANLSPSGDLSLAPLPAASPGNYPITIKVVDGSRVVYGTLEIQLTAPSIPPTDFDVTAQAVIGQTMPVNINLASKTPPGFSPQSDWTVVSNPSASSAEIYVGQSNLSITPRTNAAPGEYLAYLKVTDTTQGQPVEKFAKLRILLAPATPEKVDFFIAQEVIIGSPSLPKNLAPLLPQTLGLQEPLTFTTYSSTAPIGSLSASLSPNGALMLSSYQGQTNTVTTGTYAVYVAVTDSASKTVFGQISVQLATPTPLAIDAETAVYHDLATPPQPIDLGARLQQAAEGLPLEGIFYEIYADNAPGYSKKLDPSGFLAVAPSNPLQPGSQALIVRASSPSVGVRFLKIWLHAVGVPSEVQPTLETRILASKVGASPLVSLVPASQPNVPSQPSPTQNSFWSVEVLENPLANAWQFKTTEDGKITVSMVSDAPPVSAYATVRLKSLDPTNSVQSIARVLIDPRDFATANLLGHYDALRNDSLVRNGDLVGQWKDLSGNNHHLFAGPEGGPKTSLLSGLQTIDFYPEKGLVAQGVPLSESVTVFMVLKPSPEIRTWGSYIHHGHHDEDWAIRMNGNPGSKTGFHSSNDNDIVQEHLIPDLSYVLVGRLETTLGSNTDRRTFKIFRSDGTQTTVASSTLSKSITPGLKPLFIGKSDSGEASNGKVGEILYYSSALSDGEVSANASYLISKWMGTPLPSGGGQTGGETPTTTTQLPAQTLFNTLGASLDLNSLVPASVSLTQPFIWTMGNTPLPEGVFLSPSGELIINPLPGQTQSATSFTLAVSVTEALNPQKSASLLIPVTLEPFSEETALSATSTSPIQVTLGGVNAPVDLRPILSTAAQSIPNVDIDWNTAQLSIALTRGNGAFTARLLSGSTLSVDSLPNALPGAYDIFVKATSNSATAATKLFRVPVIVSGPTQSNVDLVLARNIVRGVPTQVDISTQVLSPLGISTSAGVEVINAANLSGGIIVSSTQDESLEITAGPSTDGISKESIFLKVSADTPKGIDEKFVRVDCTVSAFSIPSTSETFSAEITVAGVPNQESVYPLGQIIPANLLSDSTFKYRILDPSILAVKGAEALLNPESLIVKPLNDFLPGKTQLVLEAKGASRTVYGTLTVVQSPFAAPPTTFELSVQSPVGGKLKYPINLAVQMDPSLATAGQPSGVTPSPFLLDVVYNASKRGVFASLQGTSLTSLDVSQTAYLGKNVVYLRKTDTTTGATTFGKLLVNVVPSAPEQIWQQISTSVPWQPTGVSVDVRPLLESSLANRSDLEFSLYSVENTNGLNPNVAPDGVIQLQGSPAGFASNTKPITLHLSVREIATGLIRYVTLNVSVQDTEEPSAGFPAVVYVDINLPTSIVDIHQALGLTTPPEETSIQITRISNPEEISVKTFGRYALIKPSSIAQPGIYSLQVSVPDEEFADPSLTGGTRELLICAFGEAIGSSTQAPYLATADWDSPQSLTLASSSGTISLKIAANQAQNFLRAELNGGSVKFYADRSHAIPGTFKVKVTDPRSPQVQLYVNVSVPADIFRPVPTIDLIAKREFLQGQPTTVDLRSLFPGLNPSMQYTFSIPSSLEGNPLRATITPTGILTLPGFQGQAEPSGSDFSVVRMGMSWNQAKEDAFKRGGHLATFSSATEWMSMLQQVGQADGLWIGASDQLNEGKWEWVTGEAWTYQNWAGGEPNNCCGGEHFLMVSGSVWNDASGSFASGYILETPVSAVYLKATDSTGSSVMLRLDVALRAPQSQIDVEVPVNVVNQSVDLNSLTGPIGDIGPNRVWELESKSVPSLSLSPSGQITLGASPIEGHATLTARVRDLISNKSVFVTVSVRTAKPQTLEILQNPISQTVNTGSRVLLAVSAESPLRDSSQLAYQWRRNGTPIPGAIFDAYTFTVTNDSKGEYDVLISDGASQKASGKALIATDDTVFAGSLSSAIQSVVQSGTAVTLQQQSPGFRIRQVVLKPSATLGSVNTLATADLILSLPSNDSRIASTYLLSSPTLNHYGDGDSGHYPGKTRLPVSEPSYALRAEATLFIPTEGVYTFGVNSDDGSRITIDGVPVMVDDSIHGAQDFLSQPITLTSGLHSVEITMFDGGYGDHIEFFAASGAHSSWNNQFSLVGSTQGLKVYYTPISTTATSTQTTQSGLPVGETVWFDEGWMPGMQGNAGEIAVGSASLPASSGSLMFRLQGDRNDIVAFPSPWKPSSQNGFIFFDMFIPQESNSLAFMLQVGSRDGWEHRAVWGAMDQAPSWGTPDTNSRRKVGELPPKGKWTRMQLPLSSLGITSADYVRELAFSQLNGLVFIDKVGFADLPPYQWYKDGIAISGANSQTLKLSSSQSSDSGIYSLRVTNSGTSIFTSSVFLYVREAVWDPSEIMHPLLAPAPAQFQLGSTLRLAALVSGPIDVRYEWRKNGVIVPGTTSELTIANASESDAGTYSVAAISDSTLRMVEFAPVQVSSLIPVQKPIFPTTSAPRSLQIPVGTPLNLTDSATGSNVTYSWTKNGQSLQGFQTNSLFIPLVSPSDAGQYALVATNSAGSAVSAPFSVVIEVPPTFSESGQPKPASVIEGDPFQIIGNAVGASSYQWYLNGTELTGATSNSYLVLKASLGNAGTYKLVATSPFGLTAESQSVKVDVFSRPSIRLQPQHRFVALGEQAVFSVEATGSGPVSFKWFRNGTVITESNLSTFVIPAAAETDAALYSVEVSSPYGTVLSTSAQLAIKPTITAAGQPRSPVIRIGDPFSLNVQSAGTGTLAYQWFKNGVVIPAATEKTLSIVQSSVADEGQYHVEVRSDYGSTTSTPVAVGFIPVFLTDLKESVSSPKGSDIALSVTVAASSPVIYRWSKDGTALSSDAPVFFESFSSYLGNQNAVQSETGLKVAYAGSVFGWTHSGSNALHAVNRKSQGAEPDWAMMIYRDNVLTSSTIGANAFGTTYRVSFELAPAVYAVPSQQTLTGDAVTVEILRADGSALKRSEHVTGTWSANARFTQRSFEYQGDGTGPIRVRIRSAESLPDDRFKGAVDNLSIVEAGASGPTLTLRNLQELNAGSYEVVATNAFGSAVSKATMVSIQYFPPAIKDQPKSLIANVGSPATLSVTVESDLPVSYQWFRDGSPVGFNEPVLQLNPLSQSHLGEYSVAIRNQIGETVSQRVRVDAPPLFTLSQEPLVLTPQEGAPVTLSSSFSGSEPMSFQWLKNGQPIRGATSKLLSIQNTTPSDSGEYVLEIKNSFGTQLSASQTINVLQRLKIVSQPASITSNTGSPVLFSVNATSSYGPIKYQWRRNSRPIPGAIFSVFGIESASTAAQGLYDVVVSDNSTDVLTSTAANLSVSDAFKATLLSNTPHSVQRTGEVTNLSVDAPTNATIQWRRDGFTLAETSRNLSVNALGLYDAVVSSAGERIMTRQFLVAPGDTAPAIPGITVRQVRSRSGVGSLAQAEALLNLPSGHQDIVAEKTIVVPQLNLFGEGADGHYGNNLPLPLSGEPYAIRANGTILVFEAGIYTFGLNSDDGGTIRIDGKPVMIDDSNHGPIDNLSQGVELSAGTHSIEVIMWEGGGGDEVELFAAKGIHFAWNENFRLIGAEGGISVTTNGVGASTRTPDFVRFLRIPVTFDAFVGQPISVSAYAISSSPSPVQYRWQKNGDLLTGVSASILFQSKLAQVDDSGLFRLTAAAGDIISSPVDFTVSVSDTPTPPQVVDGLPTTLAPTEGTQLLLSPKVIGSAPLMFEWFKDGKLLNVKTPEFARTSVTRSDEGSYSLKVSNAFGETTIGPVLVSVMSSPIRIVGSPTSLRVGIGSPATFTVEATGSEALQYQWSKNGVAISGQTNPQLQIPKVDFDSAGTYEVRVSYPSNSGSAVTAMATLTVEPLPQVSSIRIQPTPNVVSGTARLRENAVVTLSVTASGSGPFKYLWSRSGVVLGDNAPDLVTKPLTGADTGAYSVRVETPFGAVTSEPLQIRVVAAPKITKQPKLVSAREASPLSVAVEAQSTEPITYQWRKDTVVLGNETSAVFRRNVSTPTDSGVYTVTVSDGLSEVVSEPIQVSILPEFEIKTHPSNAAATSGQDVEFFVATDSVAPLRYQWLKNGSEIPGAIAASLRLKGVTTAEEGVYSVRISSSITPRQVESNPARLVVDAPLAFIRDLDSEERTLAINGAATFEVQVSGSGTIRYKWEVSDDKGPWMTQIASGPKLSLPGLPKEGSRQVRVTATNGTSPSIVSKTAALTFADVPAIVAWSSPQTTRVGARAEMSVSASGAGVQIVWTKGNLTIAPSRVEAVSGISKSTVSIAQVSTSDAGTYVATVTSPRSTSPLTRSFELVVNESPFQITKQPVNTVIREGQSGRLSLGFESGTSDLSFQWKKSGIPLQGQTSPVLNLFKAKLSDEGTYTVEVSSKLLVSPVESDPATISIETPPRITQQPDSLFVSVRETSSTNLEVTAKGSVDLAYQWFSAKTATGASRQLVNGANASRLELKNVSPEQSGFYWVEVSNSLGVVSSDRVRLEVTPALNLTSLPKSADIAVGGTATLSVSAESLTPETLRFQWYKLAAPQGPVASSESTTVPNGAKAIPGAEKASLLIESVAEEDTAEYIVEVVDSSARKVARGAIIRAISPASAESIQFSARAETSVEPVTIPLTGDEIIVGTGNRIDVRLNILGSLPATVSVQLDGQVLATTQATTSTPSLEFRALKQHQGTLKVLVSNLAGTWESSAMRLSTSDSVKILAQPQSLTADAQSRVELSLKAIGVGKLTYRWSRNGTLLTETQSPRLLIPRVSGADAGIYQVRVSDGFTNELSSGAILELRNVILIQPLPVSVKVGQSARLRVELSSDDYEVYWLKSGTPIEGATSKSLDFSSVRASDFSVYQAVITHRTTREEIKSSEVAVTELPDLSNLNLEGTAQVKTGNALTLSVPAQYTSSLPGATYQWLRNFQPVPGASGSSLDFTRSAIGDSGVYTVRITTPQGISMSKPFTVAVVEPDLLFSSTDVQATSTSPASVNLLSFDKASVGFVSFELAPHSNRINASLAGQSTLRLTVPTGLVGVTESFDVRVFGAGGLYLGRGRITVSVPAGAPPMIAQHPVSTGIPKDGSTVLSVQASGGSLRYQWRFNETNIAGANTSVLAARAAAGRYDCVVTNEAGSVVSAPATVFEVEAPLFTVQPASVKGIAVGSSASLWVALTSTYPVSFQWFKDGVALSGQTSRVLNIVGFTPADEGSYYVTATNKFGVFSQSEPAALSLDDSAIRIIAQPQSQAVLANTPVILQVVAKGPQLSYEWFKDGVALSGQTSRVLELQISESATYFCRVSSPSATSVQSVPATVRIIQSKFSLIESKLVSKTLSVMDSLSLGISVEGEGSFLYQWMKNGAPLEGEAARKDTFVIAQVKESDAGSYSVRVTRGSESIDSKQVLVTVAPPLVFKTQPSLLTEDAYAGQDPILLEAIASDSTSRYQWRKNGIDIPNEKSNQLIIRPKAASDSGTYDVIASTFQGTRMTGRIASQSVFIRVIDALKITAQPKSVVANPGDGLALEVSTEGGSPSFEWFFKKSGATAPTLLENQTLSRLEIPSASSNDEGSYYAVIKSPKQNALTTIAATVKINKPVTITRNISPTPVTLAQGKSLTLQVAASGTLPIRYQWRKDGVPINGATNQRLIITNSKAATSATYDCVVSNVVGPVTSEAALVTMAGRLEIASQPPSLTVLNPGETFTATIALSNPSGSEKVQWYRTLGKTTRAVTGATSLSLTIPEVKEEDDAAYFAVVSGQVRLTSKLASLRVNKPVRFVSQPAPEIALVENKDLVLSVSVSGTSTKEYPIAFQWSYNGQDIPSARSQSLIIKNAKVSASGVYSVTVTNIAGKAKSQDIRVTVAPGASFGPIYAIVNGTRRSPQSVITENPSSTSAPVKFKLATDVTAGDFVVGYRWRVNGRSILAPSAETAVLDFDSLGNAEAGSYDVVITTKTKQGIIVEEVTLEAVNVVVNEPIVVTVPPVSQGTNSGSQIELRAGAKGTGLAYQWMRLNPATQVYEPISGATAPTLTLTVNEQTQGKYKVALNGTVNQVSLSEINVWLLDSIRIEKQPENLSVIAGETATLSVDARSTDDTPRNLSYRWRKNRATSGLVDGKVTSVDVVQRGSGYRQAPSVELVTTGQGTGAKAEAVMELDASGETFSVARIVVTNGGSGYDSAPEVRIVGEITPNQQGTIGRQAVAGIFAAPAQQSSPDLTLTTVSEADEGEYYVEVFDGPVDDAAPRLTSSVVNLTVRGKAKIEMQPTLLTALEGQPFDIQLVASGNEAVFQWTKTTGSGANSTSSVITTDGPKIEFASLSETDSGTYTLNVSTANPPGTATSREIVLQVIALPKELSQPEPLIEKNPLESFYIQPEISVAPQGQTFFYQWFKNDREIVGAVGRTLFINQAAEADEGRYRLEVYSQAGILKASPVDLSVNDVPRVIAAPENQTVEPGESFSLAVSALGKGLSYQWFLNGVSIPDATSSILTVDQAVNGETEGNYSVVITSSTKYGGVGEPLQTSAKAIIVVKDPTSIVKQPAAEEVSGVNLNASRTWTVEARGTNLSYQWQKNGTDIPGATQKTYRVGSAQLSDEGVYRVVVSGDLGTLQSTDFILEINKAPAFVTQPTSVSAIAGGVVEVQADVTGSAPLRFQWRKEGRALAGQTASQLRLSGASTTDAGSYDVVVSNPVGTIRSAPFRVTIAAPPQIVRDPASLVVIPGESPSLFVSASGAGPLSYQWFKDGEPLDGENASELRLPPVSMESDGRYSVSVSNAAGSVFSQTAKVTVLSPVVITTQPTDARVLLKARASLSVEVSDASLPVSYQWRKGGIPISAATSKTFTIASAQNSDSGEYDVVITNDAGSVTSAQALIIIDSAMSARPLPEKLAVNQGSGTSISVTVIGAGPFTYQWRKNGQNIVGATEDVLVFEFASVTDSGSYDVVISNPSSSVTSSKTELKVEARINITKQPESVIAAVNDSVSLSVQATASGALSYQWRRNGINITASNQPTLTLKASAETSGVYDVVISETAADQSVYSILSAGAALDLSSPVRILSKPQSLSVFQGDGAAFDVVATGTGNLTYSWSLAGKLIPNEIGHRLIIPQVTSKPPSTLTYSVTVSDGKTSETATATLTVRARPSNQSQTTAQPTGQDSSANLSLSAQVRSYLIEARAVAGAAPFEGRLYLDAETESAVISELSETLSNSFRAPEAGVTLTPALTAGELEVLKLEFRSNSGLESWSLQGPANLVASQADGSWMAHTLVGLRKVYDTTGKLIGTWMVSVQFQESVPALPPAISGASSSQ